MKDDNKKTQTYSVRYHNKIYDINVECSEEIINELKEQHNVDFNSEIKKAIESLVKKELELLDANETTK